MIDTTARSFTAVSAYMHIGLADSDPRKNKATPTLTGLLIVDLYQGTQQIEHATERTVKDYCSDRGQ